MECIEARPLIPSYLDGELSEAQARPLRKHLLDCPECRSGAQGEKNVKRWFVQDEPVAVPRDFAARVARRAFAGDSGERFGAAPAAAALLSHQHAEAPRESYLRFILQVTSIAAVVLIFLSVAIRNLSLPSGDKLRADDKPDISLEQALLELEKLDRADSGADSAAAQQSPSADEPAAGQDAVQPIGSKPRGKGTAAPVPAGEGDRR